MEATETKHYRRILRVPGHQEPSLSDLRNADLVIVGDRVVKDRYGEPRRATDEDLALANGEGLTINLTTGEKLEALLAHIERAGGGGFGIVCKPDREGHEWSTSAEFGSEAEDSPMAGGAAYGIGSTLDECLDTMLKDTRADLRSSE